MTPQTATAMQSVSGSHFTSTSAPAVPKQRCRQPHLVRPCATTTTSCHQQQRRRWRDAQARAASTVAVSAPAAATAAPSSAWPRAPPAEKDPRWVEAFAERSPALSFLPAQDALQSAPARVHTTVGKAEACGLTKFESEDRHSTASDMQPSTSGRSFEALDGRSPATFTAVFDGHAGPDAARFAAQRLPPLVAQDAKLWGAMQSLRDGTSRQAALDVAASWRRLFEGLDRDMLSEPFPSGRKAGCTALAAVCSGGWLAVANAGDTRAVLCRDGRAVRLSTDHSPEMPAERQRVEAHGGRVRQLHGMWRLALPTRGGTVTKYLAMSRALGDAEFKAAGVLSAEPDVCITRLQPDVDAFTVYASDGLWKWCQDQEAVDCVQAVVSQCASSAAVTRQQVADVAAKALVQLARMRGSHDDVTVVVEMYR